MGLTGWPMRWGVPVRPSTECCNRERISRLSFIDRPTRTVVRYERARPGELLHVDVKKLGRIRPGGGWRIHGPEFGQPGRATRKNIGYDYLHVAVDDHSRVAFVQALADEKGPTCAQFLRDAAAYFASEGVTIERVMTDNALSYSTSTVFKKALADLGISHRRTGIRRPQTNGKAERFNRTLLEEFAYKTLFTSNDQRLDGPRTVAGLLQCPDLIRPSEGSPLCSDSVNNADGNHI